MAVESQDVDHQRRNFTSKRPLSHLEVGMELTTHYFPFNGLLQPRPLLWEILLNSKTVIIQLGCPVS